MIQMKIVLRKTLVKLIYEILLNFSSFIIYINIKLYIDEMILGNKTGFLKVSKSYLSFLNLCC